MALKDLPREKMVALIDQINTNLETSPKKSTILKTISDAGHCSPKSSGIEVNLLKIAQKIGHVPKNLAQIMKTSVLTEPLAPPVIVNLRSVVAIVGNGPDQSVVYFRDGRKTAVQKPVSSFCDGRLTLTKLNG